MDTNLPLSQLDPLRMGAFSGVPQLYNAWLGPLPHLNRVDGLQDRNTETWTYDEEYKGKMLMLRDTVEDLYYLRAGYLTKRVMPIRYTNNVNLAWERLEANAHLLEITPYMTTSHAVTQKRKMMRAHLVRRGITIIGEVGFLGTPLGRISFQASIVQVTNSIDSTDQLEVIRSLTTSHVAAQQHLKEVGLNPDQLLSRFLDQDHRLFGIVHKERNALSLLDTFIENEMFETNGRGDCYLVPVDLAVHDELVPIENVKQSWSGDLAIERVQTNRLDPRNETYTLRGKKTYIVRAPQVENATESERKPLMRTRQIGEYHLMLEDCDDYTQYKSNKRSILIYSQETDKMEKISLRECLKYDALWDKDGNVNPLPPGMTAIDKRNDPFVVIRELTNAVTGATEIQAQPIRYIFELDPEFLSTDRILGGGIALLTKLTERYGPIDENTTGAQLFDIVKQIIGAVPGVDDATKFAAFFLKDGAVPAPYNAADVPADAATGKVPGAQTIKSKVADAFFQALMVQVPAAKKEEEILPIIQDHSRDVLQRGEMIRNKITGYVRERLPGTQFFDGNEERVGQWYDRQVSGYQAALQKKLSELPKSSEASEAWVKPGLAGVNYKYPASAEHSDDPLDQISFFRLMRDQAASAPASSASVPEGRIRQQEGLGLAGIGQMYYEEGYSGFGQQRFDKAKDLKLLYKPLVRHLDGLNASGASILHRRFALMYLCARFNQKRFETFERWNIPIPLNYAILRPHMQYETLGIIKCLQDGGCGFTFKGNSNAMGSFETGRKTWEIAYTVDMRAVVHEPRNVNVRFDVKVQRYEGGAGHRFYTLDTYRQKQIDNLQNSLIVVAMPVTETNFPLDLCIAGRYPGEFGRIQPVAPHISSLPRYDKLFGFSEHIHTALQMPIWGGVRQHWNLICRPGHQQNCDSTGKHSIVQPCRGHRGKNIYAGCGDIWNGKLAVLEPQNFSTMTV